MLRSAHLFNVEECRRRLQSVDDEIEELNRDMYRTAAERQLRNQRRGRLAQTRQFFAEQLERALIREGFPGSIAGQEETYGNNAAGGASAIADARDATG